LRSRIGRFRVGSSLFFVLRSQFSGIQPWFLVIVPFLSDGTSSNIFFPFPVVVRVACPSFESSFMRGKPLIFFFPPQDYSPTFSRSRPRISHFFPADLDRIRPSPLLLEIFCSLTFLFSHCSSQSHLLHLFCFGFPFPRLEGHNLFFPPDLSFFSSLFPPPHHLVASFHSDALLVGHRPFFSHPQEAPSRISASLGSVALALFFPGWTAPVPPRAALAS